MNRRDATQQKALYLFSRPEFQEDIKAIRRTIDGIPLGGFRTEAAYEKWLKENVYGKWNDGTAEAAIDKAVTKIINTAEYELSAAWHHSIKRYIYVGKIEAIQLPVGLETRVVIDELTGEPTIHVVVTKDVRRQDYFDTWERIENWSGIGWAPPRVDVGKKRKGSVKTEIGRFATDLEAKNMPYGEIAKRIKAVFGADHDYTYEQINTKIKNFKKQAGIKPKDK